MLKVQYFIIHNCELQNYYHIRMPKAKKYSIIHNCELNGSDPNSCTIEVWGCIINFIRQFYNGCNYLSMLGLKLNHVSKSGLRQRASAILLVTSFICLIWLTGNILCVHPANERRRYNVTLSLIGWAHAQNDPWAHQRHVSQLSSVPQGDVFYSMYML